MAKNRFRKAITPQEEIKTEKPKVNTLISKIKTFVIKACLYFLVLSIGSVIVLKFVPIPFTITMIDQKIESIFDSQDSEIFYNWRSLDEISKEMPLAVVASEDQLFPDHFGFDLKMMRYAYKNNLKGKKVKGASTISQQVAKNVFLWQDRSYIRKGLEAYFTLLIETIWGKNRILEVYLNVAEMGHNVFGVQAAAQKYFGKDAINLSRTECAKLAAILPSPRKWSVTNPGPYVSKRVPKIERQMRALGGTTYVKKLRKF